ncbi:MAG: leucine-rich repeat domain-containing protein [Clostridia bacterium]|nr:leucine-rich repeat domain-containing protein [Clostridia bacterium]
MKKIVTLLLTIMCCVCLCFGLAACGDGSSNGTSTSTSTSTSSSTSSGSNSSNSSSGHTHTLTHKDAVAATCTTDGNIEYWYCSDCGKYFSDEAATKEITLAETVVTGGHAYGTTYSYDQNTHWLECSGCGDKKDETAHSFDGYTCTVCGYAMTPSEGLSYTISTDGSYYTVSGIGTCEDTDIVIPSTHENIAVTAIATNAFKQQTQITSVYVPDSVTQIGSGAFGGCSGLTSMTLPFVGSSASASRASSSTLFGYIFGTEVTASDTYTQQFYSTSGYARYYLPYNLTTVTITGGSLFYGAFYACKNLESVTLGENVTSIGNWAFYNCTSLVSVTLGNSVTTINGYAFYGCTKLKNLNIPDSVTEIGDGVFTSCDALTYNEYEGGYYLGNNSNSYLYLVKIEDTTITTFTINTNAKYIGSEVFFNCSALESITIPDSVTYIGAAAFQNCSTLESITIPDTVTHLGSMAFRNCTALKNVTIGSGITAIDDYMFNRCSALESITIPSTITYIGTNTFYACTKLTSVTFEDTSGWYVTPEGSSNKSSIDVTDASQNATYLEDTYYRYYWTKSTSES